MELLPPVGWSEVATKADLVMLKAELQAVEKSLRAEIQTLRAEIQTVRGELEALRGEFHRENAKLFRNLVVMNFTMVLAMGFGMARFLS